MSNNVVTLDQLRAEKCFAELRTVLEKHRCVLLPRIVIVGTEIQEGGFQVVAVPAPPLAQ